MRSTLPRVSAPKCIVFHYKADSSERLVSSNTLTNVVGTGDVEDRANSEGNFHGQNGWNI